MLSSRTLPMNSGYDCTGAYSELSWLCSRAPEMCVAAQLAECLVSLCVCVSLQRAVISRLASTHTAPVSTASLAGSSLLP